MVNRLPAGTRIRRWSALTGLLIGMVLGSGVAAAADYGAEWGPEVGSQLPGLEAYDQPGTVRTLDNLAGAPAGMINGSRDVARAIRARPNYLSKLLQLLARGFSNAEIAGQLSLTQGTVRNYVSAVLAKLEVADRTQAAVLALRYGLVDLNAL